MAGQSLHKNMCSFCRVTKEKIDCVNLQQIRPRKSHVLQRQANNWKNSTTLDERKEIFATYGVFYSILYELPYFDPLKHAIVEPMHHIFLGLLKYHGQSLFGLKRCQKKSFQPNNLESSSDQDNSQGSQISNSEDAALQDEGEETTSKDNQKDEQTPDELVGGLQDLNFASESKSESCNTSESDSSSSESDSPQAGRFLKTINCEDPTELNPLGAQFFAKDKYIGILRDVRASALVMF